MEEYKMKIHNYINSIKKKISKRFPKNDERIKKLLNSIRYVHSRLRYEVEIPNELVNGDKKLDELVMTSYRAGF